jgi:hypothetical protein
MKGNITRRGKTSSRVKFDVGFDPITGKRKYHTETLRGAKSDAVNLLAKRISEQAEGQLVERTALPLATFARHWLSVIAPVSTSPQDARALCGAHRAAHHSPTRRDRNTEAPRTAYRRLLQSPSNFGSPQRKRRTVRTNSEAHPSAAISNPELGS